MELIIFVGYGNDIIVVNYKLLIVSCMNVYKCILGLPSAATLVHLKLKYHKRQRELATISSYLEGSNRINKDLQKDQGEDRAKEINVASLTGKLSGMGICPLKSG